MRTWVLRIRAADQAVFAALVDGRKRVETRAGSAAPRGYRHVQPGDTLLFLCGAQRLRRVVTRVTIYPSVEALLAAEDYRAILPDARSPADVAALYTGIPGYPERIARYGLIAMELALAPAT